MQNKTKIYFHNLAYLLNIFHFYEPSKLNNYKLLLNYPVELLTICIYQ